MLRVPTLESVLCYTTDLQPPGVAPLCLLFTTSSRSVESATRLSVVVHDYRHLEETPTENVLRRGSRRADHANAQRLTKHYAVSRSTNQAFANSLSGGKSPPALHPYNSRQRKALAMEQDLEARHGGNQRYLLPTANVGASEGLSATSVQQTGTNTVMNPFLTSLWPQHPENMTLLPRMLAPQRPRTDSWRRMQLTSPPVTSLSMSLWCAYPYDPPVSATAH